MGVVIQFPKQPVKPWDFPVLKRRPAPCVEGMRQIWDDGFEWDTCPYCHGAGCAPAG